MSEKRVEEKLKKYFKLKGIWFIKVHGGQFQKSGTPDLLVCWKGLFMAIECKWYPNKTTALQEYNLNKIKRNYGLTFVINQHNVDEFIKTLDFENVTELTKFSFS